jgi:hypothetical protein
MAARYAMQRCELDPVGRNDAPPTASSARALTIVPSARRRAYVSSAAGWRWTLDQREMRYPAAVLQELLCVVLSYTAWRLDQPGQPACVRKRGALVPLLSGAGTTRMAGASAARRGSMAAWAT